MYCTTFPVLKMQRVHHQMVSAARHHLKNAALSGAVFRRCCSSTKAAAEPSHVQKQVTGRGGLAALLFSGAFGCRPLPCGSSIQVCGISSRSLFPMQLQCSRMPVTSGVSNSLPKFKTLLKVHGSVLTVLLCSNSTRKGYVSQIAGRMHTALRWGSAVCHSASQQILSLIYHVLQMCKHEGLSASGDGRCPAIWTELTEDISGGSSKQAEPSTGQDQPPSSNTTSNCNALGELQLGFPYLGEVQSLPVQQWPHQSEVDIQAGDGVVVPAGSWVMRVGDKLWMKDA